MGKSDLAKEAETLATFKGRIDKILENLEDSSSSLKSIADQTITKDAYGTGFDSAQHLAELYEQVHERLKTLSKTFGDQVEAMGLAALIADRGYDGIDAEQAARMRAIEERTRKFHKGPVVPPRTTDAPGSGAQPQPPADKSVSGTGGADGL
ncbi:hypothetical protein [Streptomyces sp. NPDC002537]